MLAPGGGAEVLPIGLFSDGPGGPSPWFVNNGIATSSTHSNISEKTNPYPPEQPSLHTSSSSSSSASVSSHTSSSPFDFDFNKRSPSTNESEPHAQSPTALSLHISSGLINPQGRITFNQLNAIGAGAAVGSSTLNAPSPLGLPVYSGSGFDLLSVLARVAARPDPKVALGPVDFSSSFLVVDVRRYDNPIIYCSPSFCRLTGYEEHEVLGKNCRFLQSPNGVQPKGEYRRFTSNEAVSYLKKHLVADKECQTSIINYRKSGDAFINLVTVIPIKGGDISSPHEDDKVIYHVGFQVDLTEQPNAILEKVKDGSYIANYAANNPVTIHPPSLASFNVGSGTMHGMARDRKMNSISAPVVTPEFKAMVEDPIFMANYPISTGGNADSVPLTSTTSSSMVPPPTTENVDLVNVGPTSNHPLSLLLLEYAPDFIHVVSLKGTFLYVGPSVRRVLGYEPEELVGKALSDICHPADVQPLTRELKESSATGSTAPGGNGTSQPGEESLPLPSASASRQLYPVKPRAVNLLFRARTKSGQYVWVECCGRLHVEPGKGRKAIMLSGRAKEMSMLPWSAIASAGGISHPQTVAKSVLGEDGKARLATVDVYSEFWGTLTRTGSLLVVGKGVKDVLGWDEGEMMGKQIWSYLIDEEVRRKVGEELANMGPAMGTMDAPGSFPRKIYCRMSRRDGSTVEVEMVLYPSAIDTSILHSPQTISPAPIIYQIRLYDRSTAASAAGGARSAIAGIVHPLKENVFKVLEISRDSSWQYELKQLKFMNERLKEEIMSIEGDEIEQQRPQTSSGPSMASKQSTRTFEATPTTTTSSAAAGLVNVNSSAGATATSSNPTSAILASANTYDRHVHQGIGSASFAPPHSVYTTSGQYSSHTQYPQHSSLSYAQPQAWPPPPHTNSTATAISMPMPYVSPTISNANAQYDHLSSSVSSSSLKRTWASSDRNGNSIT
ncbi:photoreceptor A [Lentinula raphanica]|uniref:Photoreceptor A n=1 Tax=Lentinula raphanica TaxID=153919 RepID=A0AA38NYC6_9AGAR|nr:photoreceptor A [Lentinula raphanica]